MVYCCCPRNERDSDSRSETYEHAINRAQSELSYWQGWRSTWRLRRLIARNTQRTGLIYESAVVPPLTMAEPTAPLLPSLSSASASVTRSHSYRSLLSANGARGESILPASPPVSAVMSVPTPFDAVLLDKYIGDVARVSAGMYVSEPHMPRAVSLPHNKHWARDATANVEVRRLLDLHMTEGVNRLEVARLYNQSLYELRAGRQVCIANMQPGGAITST